METSEIGRVVAVHGFHLKVELNSAQKSPVRAGLDGTETQLKINAYVTCDIGAGEAAMGVITDLDSHEGFEPGEDDLSLHLVRARRIATVQLLGTVRFTANSDPPVYRFDPGVNVLPTLETAVHPAKRRVLEAVLTETPKRNEPCEPTEEEFDGRLQLGTSTAVARAVFGSYNDLFSRPLAVVGNTGSGKSCTIAHLLQAAIRVQNPEGNNSARPRFFVLDINGEYARAFGKGQPPAREPNKIYVNGQEWGIPLWLMTAHEACVWLNAAEQTQQPALVNLWAIAKNAGGPDAKFFSNVRSALDGLTQILTILGSSTERKKGQTIKATWAAVMAYAPGLSGQPVDDVEAVLTAVNTEWACDRTFGKEEPRLKAAVAVLQDLMEGQLGDAPILLEQTADKPIFFPIAKLDNPVHLEAAAELSPGDRAMRQFLLGLQLRIRNRRNDKRWQSFYNYEKLDIKTAAQWFNGLGIGGVTSSEIVVIDLSMLAHEVMPYACGVIGRMLLELREYVPADKRFFEPWVVVLEEAHNYVRPRREDEARGVSVSRETFERIAKEGRKFGLSVIVASQRPSEISQTILSQCANFLLHRLQNPDDIEHFRKIVPSQSRRLLDQITILAAGEAIAVGSAFHIPSRVMVQRADPTPSSESSTPFTAWRGDSEKLFELSEALQQWGVLSAQDD
jgi:DNA helicase HerA-like ATPase